MNNRDKPTTPVTLGVQNADAHPMEKGDLIGLTKREYFAAMAMQGMVARVNYNPEQMSRDALEYADALLEELEKPFEHFR